jgi:hypothetical protein
LLTFDLGRGATGAVNVGWKLDRDPSFSFAGVEPVVGWWEERVEFTVEMEGVRLSCASPWCIQRLTQLGWRLADPSQADQLKAELSAREAASSESGKLHRLEPDLRRARLLCLGKVPLDRMIERDGGS